MSAGWLDGSSYSGGANTTELSSADLTAVLYRHYNNSAIVAPLTIEPNTLPKPIIQTLNSLRFDQLDPYLQRAILWDAGYILRPIRGSQNLFTQIYTLNGIAMSEIELSHNEIENAGCDVQSCSHPGYGSTWRSTRCSAEHLEPMLQCAIDLAHVDAHLEKDMDQSRSLWALRNPDDLINLPSTTGLQVPTLNIALHSWEDRVNSSIFQMFSIHTVPFDQEPTTGQCPTHYVDDHGNLDPVLIIPCAAFNSSSGKRSSVWKKPKRSGLLEKWLASVRSRRKFNLTATPQPDGLLDDQLPSSGSNSSSVSNQSDRHDMSRWIVPIIIATIVCVAIVMGFFVTRRRRGSTAPSSKYTRDTYAPSDGYLEGTVYLSPYPNDMAHDLIFHPENKEF